MKRVGTEQLIVLIALLVAGFSAAAAGGVVYSDPAGGWTYIFTGDSAAAGPSNYFDSLDGTWDHTNGSDAWDGSQIGQGTPGGVSALSEGGTNYVRLQEPGDPRDHGYPDPGSNRKLMFVHDIEGEAGPDAEDILDRGVTISFRARIATGPGLDDLYPAGGVSSAWPAGGDGYVIHDGGKSNFSVRQRTGSKIISFALALASDDDDIADDGLVMNKLNGSVPSGDVDLQGESGGNINILKIGDMTAWHEFWIVIEPDGSGTGTHKVSVYLDGSLDPVLFTVTAGNGSDYGASYVALGAGATPQSGAIDVDFFAYKAGVQAPSGGNLPPTVEAGEDQTITLPINYALLNGFVEDDGIGEPDGFLEIVWSQVSGPAEAVFEPDNSVVNPTATFPALGRYTLMLSADDGQHDVNDLVSITVLEPNCPVGDLDGNCKVDFEDVRILGGRWLDHPACQGFGCPDLDGVNGVDTADYALLAANWFERWLGALKVTISPPEAVDAGAQWRIEDRPWRNSGDKEGDLIVGSHKVIFSAVADWIKPDDQTVEIQRDQTLTTSGLYQSQPPSSLIISEIMANKGSNLVTRVDGEWVRPDWIEIYNGMDELVNLQGWYLTDDDENLTKWRFPSLTIGAGQYRVVFASEKDRRYYPTNYPYYDGTYYHTNFELDRAGEYLALVKPDGLTIAHEYAPEYPEQRAYYSYGYCSDSGTYTYFEDPSPNGENSQTCLTGVVADTKFSHDRGFYDTPFYVAVMTATPGATIHYTTDGSTPTRTHGQAFAYPVLINKTTSLRAMAFKDGLVPTNVDTQTYIFLDDVIQQTGAGFPNTWGHAGADYEMDGVVVGAYSATIRNDLKSVPTMSMVMSADDWFGSNTGIYANPEWEDQYDEEAERFVSVEFFDPCGAGEFHINAVVRIAGGSSTSGWKSDKLSMRLKFQEPFGPTKLDYPLFDSEAAESFDTLVLDARLNNAWNYGNNDSQRRIAQYTRDQYTSDMQNATGGYGHHGLHVHLYLNGLYWGLYNLHERPDESFAASYFGGSKKDYDVLKHNEGDIVNGSNANYLQMCNLAESGLVSDSQYRAVGQYLDTPNFIDYMITNFYYGNTDWAHQNWYSSRSRFDPAGRWRFHSWDAEKGMQGVNDDVTSKDNGYGSPTRLHQRLAANAEYKMLFADRVHRHFFNDGVLTVENATALYQRRLDEVDRAVVGESARWGDNRIEQSPYVRYTRDEHWVTERDRLLNSYFPARTSKVLGQLRNRGLYPSVQAPSFTPHGGWDRTGIAVSITNVQGTGQVYYTTDGTDPRQYLTGNPVGLPYSGPLTLTKSCQLKARVRDGQWSALNEAVFGVGPLSENLRITELMYHPKDTGDPNDPNEEYIELANVGSEKVNLNLVRFTRGLDFVFPDMELAAGEYVVVVADRQAFESRYGVSVRVAGQYTGRLDNGGERIRLEDAVGRQILDFRYKDGWRPITDGQGFSLTIIDATDPDPNTWALKQSWRASAVSGGSPGVDDSGLVPVPGSVVINEVLAHSRDFMPDWIELYNTTDHEIEIGGWYLSDSDANAMKYEIKAGTKIGSNEYLVFFEDVNFGEFSGDAGSLIPFALSENGEQVVLSSAEGGILTGYREVREFGASPTDVSFGRYITSEGDAHFVLLESDSAWLPNSYPQVGPIVITEIMYHPDANQPGVTRDAEYVELYNAGNSTVTFYDYVTGEPWRFTDDPEDPGIDLLFPYGPVATLDSGKYLLLVRDLAAFNSAFTAPVGVQILEWENGRLDNAGEPVQISLPGDVDKYGRRHYICADRIDYDDEVPWPLDADGQGSSLRRISTELYGNDPNNWTSATPSPGQ
jgi:hypothetical protein